MALPKSILHSYGSWIKCIISTNNFNNRNGVNYVCNVDWCCVCFALVSGFLRMYIIYSIGRRMNGKEYENTLEINCVMAKEGRVFSTAFRHGYQICIKDNKATLWKWSTWKHWKWKIPIHEEDWLMVPWMERISQRNRKWVEWNCCTRMEEGMS